MIHSNLMEKNDSLLEILRNTPRQHVKVAITDVDGVLRGKYLHRDKFFSAAESGFGFCNVVFGWDSSDVCYDQVSYTGWHTGYPDALAKVDLETCRQVPWDQGIFFFLCDFESAQGRALEVCPRQLLKKVIAKARSHSLEPVFGVEYEWFNFRETPQSLFEKQFTKLEPITPGMFGYSLLRSTQNQPYFRALLEELLEFGVPIEGLHTETGPGVFEAAILYSQALEAADRASLFKTSVKEIAHRFGIVPCFMAKWSSTLPGCSGHIHQSLWDKSNERNMFFDEKDPHRMSKLFKSYLAGQLLCLPEILPFFAPTVNSYKRLVDGFWAPTRATWGVDNRTTAFRVLPGSDKSTRVEARVPGADMNPYLAIAACLASGLYGIEKNLELKDSPVRGSCYRESTKERLPKNLGEATERLSRSQIAREILGGAFVDHFVKTREWEWQQFLSSVTQWELRRYMEII